MWSQSQPRGPRGCSRPRGKRRPADPSAALPQPAARRTGQRLRGVRQLTARRLPRRVLRVAAKPPDSPTCLSQPADLDQAPAPSRVDCAAVCQAKLRGRRAHQLQMRVQLDRLGRLHAESHPICLAQRINASQHQSSGCRAAFSSAVACSNIDACPRVPVPVLAGPGPQPCWRGCPRTATRAPRT